MMIATLYKHSPYWSLPLTQLPWLHELRLDSFYCPGSYIGMLTRRQRLGIVKKMTGIVNRDGLVDDPFERPQFDDSDDDFAFLKKLDSAVRRYHEHSSVYRTRPTTSESSMVIRRRKKSQKKPSISWDPETKIMTLKFYTYLMEPDEGWDGLASRNVHVDRVRRALDRKAAEMVGVVVDLSEHHGGSFLPFLHAVGMHFLRDVGLFHWVSRDVTNEEYLAYTSAGELVDRKELFERKASLSSDKKVVVIIGPRTASSGEIAAACFYKKAGARTFGSATAGFLSVNEGYDLGHGFVLNLTVMRVCTTDGVCHEDERLHPDVESSDPERDAIAWLSGFSPNRK